MKTDPELLPQSIFSVCKLINSVMNVLFFYYGYYIRRIVLLTFTELEEDPYKIIYVKTDNIQYRAGHFSSNPFREECRFSRAYFVGSKTKSGKWDKERTELQEIPKFKSVINHFNEGKDWDDTQAYTDTLSKVNKYGKYDRCQSEQDVIDRYAGIDRLYHNIDKFGFKKSNEIEGGKRCGLLDYVCVNIGRNGDILFNGNGHHRLSIAKALSIDKIPVRVLIRHRDWENKRKNQVKHSNSKTESTHPDINIS